MFTLSDRNLEVLLCCLFFIIRVLKEFAFQRIYLYTRKNKNATSEQNVRRNIFPLHTNIQSHFLNSDPLENQ